MYLRRSIDNLLAELFCNQGIPTPIRTANIGIGNNLGPNCTANIGIGNNLGPNRRTSGSGISISESRDKFFETAQTKLPTNLLVPHGPSMYTLSVLITLYVVDVE